MKCATITTWVKYFEENEGIQISYVTIRNKLKEAGIIGLTARDRMGRIFKNSFYAETDIREVCADLLVEMPQADEEGFFELDGEKYGIIKAWERVFPISKPTIDSKLEQNQVKGIKGKDFQGKIRDFYTEIDIRIACADLLENLPLANKDGFFEKEGIKYGTAEAWSRILPISRGAIVVRLEQVKLKSIKGKDLRNRLADFHSESYVLSACADLLKEYLPQADEHGFFELNGVKYSTIRTWSKVLSISTVAITCRLKQAQIKSAKGKMKGRISNFYSEPDVRSACANLLQDIPQADDNGFFELNDNTYGTINAWGRVLPIAETTIRSRLEQNQINGIKGKIKGGQICAFYSESDIRSVCADLLEEDLPQANEDSFFELDGAKYGTIGVWKRVLPISESSITSRLKNTKGIRGKDKSHRIQNFYSESDIRSACADLLEANNYDKAS